MTKLEKIDKELSKAREKAAEWQTKIRDLEKQRQEEENSMIVQAVRSLKLTPAELAEFFRTHPKQYSYFIDNFGGMMLQFDIVV